MSASSVLLFGETHNAVVCELLQAACSECAWSGRQTLQNGAINVRSSSSKRAHQGIWNDYIEICALTGVDPKQLSVSTAAHVAKLYFFRTKQLALSLSVSNHTSAEMTSIFVSLDHQGRWTTEVDASQNPIFFGSPHNFEIVDKAKKAHKIKVAHDGRVTLLVDPVECAFCDHHLRGQVDASPVMLALHAAMMTAMFCLCG